MYIVIADVEDHITLPLHFLVITIHNTCGVQAGYSTVLTYTLSAISLNSCHSTQLLSHKFMPATIIRGIVCEVEADSRTAAQSGFYTPLEDYANVMTKRTVYGHGLPLMYSTLGHSTHDQCTSTPYHHLKKVQF